MTSKIWPRFHVKLLRKASEDPVLPQKTDDSQPPPIRIKNKDDETQLEKVVERISRADKFRRGGAWNRRVLSKRKDFVGPNWEDRSHIENVKALDDFEAKFGAGDRVGEDQDAR